MWTKSACVVLAWSILAILVAASMKGSVRPAQANTAQANIRIASSSSTTHVTLTSTLSASAVLTPAPSPAARYVVQPGDTLAGIAGALAVRGGWPALYAANRPLIGADPDLIHPGIVLAVPGRMTLVRYTVAPGNTLSGIAAALAVHGGWRALYAANRQAIGPDPDVIHAGTVLRLPRAAHMAIAALRAPTPSRLHKAPRPVRTRTPRRRVSARTTAPAGVPAGTGMPRWLTITLVAVGLLIAAAFLAEWLLAAARRRREAAEWLARLHADRLRQRSGLVPLAGHRSRVILADHDRLIVTHIERDNAVYVLRPPGEDPEAIMRVARLVLPEAAYRELARELGLPASWPFVLADYDRVVVTCRDSDDTVYVLRPPGEDPREIMRAARLVLHEDPYEELAGQLGVSASWPMGLPVLAVAGRGGGRPGPDRAGLAVGPLRPGPVPQRFDQCGHVTPVLRRQLVDAGDQEFSVRVARTLLPGCRLVVVVHSCRLRGGRAYRGDGHLKTFGERVDRRRPWRPDQVPCRRQGVDRRARQSAAPGDVAIGPAPLVQTPANQALQGIDVLAWQRDGVFLLPRGEVPRRMRRHTHQPSPSSPDQSRHDFLSID